MRLRSLLVLFAAVVIGTGVSHAASFSIAFNDNAYDFWGGFNLGKDEAAKMFLGGRYLYNDDDDTKVPAFVFGFETKPDANEDVGFMLGLQALFGKTRDLDVEGIAVGGSGDWGPAKWKGVYVGGRIFYGPEVFSWGDSEGYFEFAFSGGYKINPKMRIFLEYQKVEVDLPGASNTEVDEGTKIGFSVKF